jgi:hypothetical protein
MRGKRRGVQLLGKASTINARLERASSGCMSIFKMRRFLFFMKSNCVHVYVLQLIRRQLCFIEAQTSARALPRFALPLTKANIIKSR